MDTINLQSRDAVPSPRIPEFHHIILASRNQQPLRGVPLHALYVPPMACRKVSKTKNACHHLKIPVNTRSSRCSSKAHIRTVESSLAVANLLSSGLKLNARMASR